jgi:DNA polymerase family B
VSRYEAHRIEKPRHFRIAPSTRGRGPRRLQVIGFDSEAENGRAFCLQFSVEGGPEAVHLLTVPERRHGALATLMRFVSTQCTSRSVEYVMFGWNLMYEWTQLFPDFDRAVVALSEFAVEAQLTDAGQDAGTWTVTVFNDRRYAARFYHHETQRRVVLLDGMAFFKTGLAKAGKALGAGEKVDLDEDRKRRFNRADLDDPEFRRYACTDAWLTRVIGERIMDMHVEFDVPTCLTAPHFASQVFKRHFLTAEIPLPDPHVEQAGLAAYHGGKNGFYLPGPRRLPRVWAYDITSAYPEAMRQLPDPTRAPWRLTWGYRPGLHGLWRVAMDYAGCPYPGALTHDDRKLTPGRYEGLWVTSYELDAILARGEATLTGRTHGYHMRGPAGGPLVAFVDRFFAQKAAAGEGPVREQAKLFLNSLYGKFFQKVELGVVGYVEWGTGELVETAPDQPFDYRAGGLYHPPIAALITGYVRGRIHALEHKYESVMTSTDGFFGLRPPDPADMGPHLGGLTAQEGSLDIWRERLYVFDPAGGAAHCPGKPCKEHRPKAALHGFRGDLAALRAVPLAPGDHDYPGTVTVSLRTARNRVAGRAVRAGQFVDTTFTLHLAGTADPGGATIGVTALGRPPASPPAGRRRKEAVWTS